MDDLIYHWMSPAARLRVTGDDAATFLQGQFSNDLRRREESPATYGIWLNHKGRALADSHVLQLGPNVFEVISRTSPAETIRERLETYIIADDVIVEDVTASSTTAVLVVGTGADNVIAELGWPVPGNGCFSAAHGGLVVPARCDIRPSWMILFEAAGQPKVAAALAKIGARQVGREAVERRRIAAGIPSVPDEVGPNDLPPEAGLEQDAISYTKGCYLGQEVMARLHNLGQVRRRLFVVRLDAAAANRGGPGAPALFSKGKKVGELRGIVRDPDGGDALGMAMLQVLGIEIGTELAFEPESAPAIRVERLVEGCAP